MSSPDDVRPEGPPPGDVAPIESDPVGAEVPQPPAAADDARDELTSDTEGTGVDSSAPQQDIDPGTPEGAGTAEPKDEAPSTPPTDDAAAPEQPPATDAADAVEVPVAEASEPTPPPFDERRSPLLEKLAAKLGDAVVQSELVPGVDLWVRVRLEAWADVAKVLRDELGFTYFCFLSVIDWMPSPFGKSEDDSAPVEINLSGPFETGVAGGETRFQLFARLEMPGTSLGINLKTDVGDDLVAPTWSDVFAGANWHEREAREMYGVDFAGHPHMVNLYLPGGFEGHPGRKDFPLLARMVKPWPGLVDVEPMPGEDPEEADAEAEVAE
ncbi:MAG: nuoC [Acidimicrobiales bacterium]|nr:nuoC [Acidimicrobiales bacterium]